MELVGPERLQAANGAEDCAHVGDGVDDVAGPSFAFRADHRGALRDPAERLSEIRRTADEGNRESPLVDVMLDIGRGQDLGLVDVVDLELLEDLGLREVPDAALGHHWDRDCVLDLANPLRVAHPRHATVTTNVRRDTLERHDGARARFLSDPGLVGVDDVHDHAALQHLGEARLDSQRAVLGHEPECSRGAGPDGIHSPVDGGDGVRPNSALRPVEKNLEKRNAPSDVKQILPYGATPLPAGDAPGPKLRHERQGARPPGPLVVPARGFSLAGSITPIAGLEALDR